MGGENLTIIKIDLFSKSKEKIQKGREDDDQLSELIKP